MCLLKSSSFFPHGTKCLASILSVWCDERNQIVRVCCYCQHSSAKVVSVTTTKSREANNNFTLLKRHLATQLRLESWNWSWPAHVDFRSLIFTWEVVRCQNENWFSWHLERHGNAHTGRGGTIHVVPILYTHTTNVNKRQRVENSAEIDVNKFNHMIYTYLYIFCPCGCHHFDITKGAWDSNFGRHFKTTSVFFLSVTTSPSIDVSTGLTTS